MLESIKVRWRDLLEEHPHLESAVSALRYVLPPINYITVHYAYFIFLSLLGSVIFWGSSNPHNSIHYVDCLFLAVSAVTDTGLNTINLSQMTTWQQVLLWILFIIGSSIWVSWWTVMTRKHAFEERFEDIVEAERERRRRALANKTGPSLRKMFSRDKYSTEPSNSTTLPGLGTRQPVLKTIDSETELEPIGSPARRIVSAPKHTGSYDLEEGASTSTLKTEAQATTGDHIAFAEPPLRHDEARTSAYEPGNHITHRMNRQETAADSVNSDESEDFLFHFKKFLGAHNTSDRGQFYDLSTDEREKLGGCEYRALKVLAVTVPMYGFLWQMLGAVALACWIAVHKPEAATAYGANPWWAGIFLSVSAFNNAGMSLIDANMAPFQGSYFVLIIVAVLVLAGNTAYPLFMRFIMWGILRILQLTTAPTTYGPWKETLEFILKYPRRVYTTLFPSRATWWLLSVLLLINIVDWVAFEVLNIGNPVLTALPVGHRIVDGLFQAIVVRAAGFVVISIPSLYPGVQLLFLIMMYVSVYPVVVTMRHSNVYEERSLGIYEDDPEGAEIAESSGVLQPREEPSRAQRLRRRATAAVNQKLKTAMTFHGVGVRRPPQSPEENSRVSFIGQQIRGQLAHDLWWLVLALLIIVIIETDHFRTNPVDFSLFNVLFEGVSAYGNIGLSMGMPNDSMSFVGGWHKGSKFVLALVMLRGRHRGLPVAIDRAVRLPGEKLYKEEEEDYKIRRTKTFMERAISHEV